MHVPLLPVPPDKSKFISPFEDPALDGYMRDLSDWYGHIRFVGLPVLKDTGRHVPLSRLFVEPRLSLKYLHSDKFDDDAAQEPTYTVSDLVVDHPRLVLLGDPGSGKSTIISWLCTSFTNFGGSELSKSLGQLIPVPITLRELVLPGQITWDSLFEAFLERPLAYRIASARPKLEGILASGQAIFLIDGFDEVSPTRREEIKAAIWEGWGRYQSCRWVLTSRVVGYERCPIESAAEFTDMLAAPVIDWDGTNELQVWKHAYRSSQARRHGGALSGLFHSGLWEGVAEEITIDDDRPVPGSIRLCPRLYVAPFTRDQIRSFALNWHRLRASNDFEAEDNARDLYRAIAGDKGTITLARVPNLLTLMALIHRQHATLPNGRALLFGKITEAYLESIDQARRLRPVVESSRSEKERWLADVAFEMQLSRSTEGDSGDAKVGEIRVPEHWLLEQLAKMLVTRRKVDRETAKTEAAILLGVIAERSGLLLPRGSGDLDEMWAFAHLSFQEYFAAQRLRRAIRSPGWNQSAGLVSPSKITLYAQSEVWRETLVLVFESLAEDEAEDTSWPDYLAQVIFAPLYGDSHVRGKYVDLRNLTTLGVTVLKDPHSGLNLETRREIARGLWGSYFRAFGTVRERFGWGPVDPSLPANLLEKSEFSGVIRDAMMDSADEFRPDVLTCVGGTMERLYALFDIPSLTGVSLFGVRLSEEDIRYISGHDRLLQLRIELGTNVNPMPLKRLRNLRMLTFSGGDCKMTKSFLEELSDEVFVRYEDLDHNGLVQYQPILGRINGLGIVNVDEGDLMLLSDAKALRTLSIFLCPPTLDLTPLRSLPCLRKVSFHGLLLEQGPDLTPLRGMKDLIVRFPNGATWEARKELPTNPW